ncbi:MAG: 30S ribosomal protein S17 [Planctomycetota bacterium]|jgi:small subunit ribosomal protein S17
MATENATERGLRKTVQGVVKSTKMDKTITVETKTQRLHPKFKKFVKHFTKFHAHDEKGEANEGDLVEIEATRPYSKTKRYRLVKVVRKAKI